MKFSLLFFASLIVLAPPVTSKARRVTAYCCPNDEDYVPASKEYFDECEGCYAIPSDEVPTAYICRNKIEFYNFPGGLTRRLEQLADGARVVEINGEKVVEYPDGRRLLPYKRSVTLKSPKKDERALEVEQRTSFPSKVTPKSKCTEKNDLCCCDYTGTGILPPTQFNSGPYKYEPCEVSCYFFDNEECSLLNTDPDSVVARPYDVLPTCADGRGTFRTAECDPGLALGGLDPHFRSWAGEWYDFHGECSLVLLTSRRSALGPIDIHIRTRIRYDYSFVESTVLRLGNSTLEVSGWGQYMLDGVLSAEMPALLAGYPVTYKQLNQKEHILEVHLSKKERIVLSTFKDWVTTKIENATYSNFQGSLGLMGKYPHGKLVGRDGFTTFPDHNAFGQEWQVRDTEPVLFQAVQGPQYPQDRCVLPGHNGKGYLRPGKKVSKEDAKKACTDSVFYEGHLELCIADVVTSGDVDIAHQSSSPK